MLLYRMKNKAQLKRFIGKTIAEIKMSDAHGDVLIITFDDGTKVNIGTYDPIDVRNGTNSADELGVFYENREL